MKVKRRQRKTYMVDPFELCRIFGWKRIDQALTYYQKTASQLAARLG